MARNRLTLLEIVQRVLSAMNHDAVSTINGTVESAQIAEEARIVYYDLMDRDDWPHLLKAIPLDEVADANRPNFLQIPEDVVRIEDIRYEVTQAGGTDRLFDKIKYLTPQQFLDLVYARNSSDSNVEVVSMTDGVDLLVINDKRPYHWTTFDDDFIVFDNYDSAVDANYLAGSKSVALVKEIPPWTHSDGFIPDMPDQMFSTLIAEVTASSFLYWKQGPSPTDERRAARGISRLRKDAEKTNEKDRRANYGRPKPRHFVRSEDGVRGSIRASLS